MSRLDVICRGARRLEGLQLLMSRQSVDEQPQTHVLTLRGGDEPAVDRQLTQFPHPYPTLRGLQVKAPDGRGLWYSSTALLV